MNVETPTDVQRNGKSAQPSGPAQELSASTSDTSSPPDRWMHGVQLDRQQLKAIEDEVPGGPENLQEVYPLSPLQEGMLFHRLLNEWSDTYVLATLLKLESDTHATVLIRALQNVVGRHDALRTAVVWEGLPRPMQVVYREATLPVEQIVLDDAGDPIAQLKEQMRPGRHRFDLRRAPLVRLQVASISGAQRYAILYVHHLICDHQSLNAVIGEALAYVDGHEHMLPPPGAYRSYVVRALEHAASQDAERFFHDKFSGIDEPTAPFGLIETHGDGSRIEEVQRQLDSLLSRRIREQAHRTGASAARLFHATWALVVAATSGRDDVVFGTVLSVERKKGSLERRTLGMSVNTLPLRLQLQGISAQELVKRTHEELLQLLNYGQTSLTLAQRCAGLDPAAPLFTSLLNYRRGAMDGVEAAGVRVLARGEAWTNYPISVIVDDLGEGFAITVQSDRRADAQRIVAYIDAAVQSLLKALEHAPDTPALALSILPQNERKEVITLFNPRQALHTRHRLIHELFEEQVERTPNAGAVVFEGQLLTYSQLNAKANQLANYLKAKGTGPDQVVALCVERGLEMVVGLLGILKAGGAYLPLDPNYPVERLAYMLEDAAPLVLLVQSQLRAKLPETSAAVIALDEDWNLIGREPAANLDARTLGLRPSHLAYVIYTSGSTGKPKGVMIEHRNVTRLFDATAQWFSFAARDVWTLFHSYAFDFSVWELWGALLYGGRVVVVPHATARSAQEFYRLLCDEGVTVLNQTPSAFAQLIDAQARNHHHQHSLRAVIFGGEALDLHTLRPWVERNGVHKPQLVNMYGITETTVHVTYRLLTHDDIESGQGSLIGEPLPDLRVHLLNPFGQPVPIGVPGEIHVGGDGVARGYLNKRELTAQRFIADPFTNNPDARLYRSGDLARWRRDGTLEYLGRNDEQVKIRGFRIELGEIEAALVRHAHVRDAAVIAREDVRGEKRLVAYVVLTDHSDSPTAPPAETLRAHLKAALPDYMVPSAFVLLEQLPLTANGKLDRRALPAPDIRAHASRSYEAPQTEIEETLAGIWRELLQIERVSRNDDFFELGGHSLLAMQVMARIESVFNAEMPIRLLFELPTVQELAAAIPAQFRSRSAHGIAVNGADRDELFEQVAAMTEDQVEALLRELTTEERL